MFHMPRRLPNASIGRPNHFYLKKELKMSRKMHALSWRRADFVLVKTVLCVIRKDAVHFFFSKSNVSLFWR